ncbi:MAG: hypothetical protein Q4C00_03105 [Bacillota bacterium]|nr:hypothetical protein [Bacillota bacterium]
MDKKRVIIGIVILAVIVIAVVTVIWPYYEQRKYTGERVELPAGLTATETVESYLDFYGKGDTNAVMSFHYEVGDNYLPPSLWLVKDVRVEEIEDVSEETDFAHSRTGNIESYDKACVKVTYSIDYYFKSTETRENYYYYLVQVSPDSGWLISDQGPV